MFCRDLPPTTAQRQPKRSVTWVGLAGTGLAADGIMEITVGKTRSRYVVTEMAVAPQYDARAFRCAKPQGESGTDDEASSYDVLVSRTGAGHKCECKGFLRWSDRVSGRLPNGEITAGCKHLDSLIELCSAGQLAELLVNPEEDSGLTVGELEDRCYSATDYGF